MPIIIAIPNICELDICSWSVSPRAVFFSLGVIGEGDLNPQLEMPPLFSSNWKNIAIHFAQGRQDTLMRIPMGDGWHTAGVFFQRDCNEDSIYRGLLRIKRSNRE